MAIVYLGNAGGGSGGGVQDVTAADTSIVVAGTAAHPTVRTGTLDVIAADHPPAADWSNNSHKITSLANGTAAQDAQVYGQGVASLLTTTGDVPYASAAHTLARLGIGAAGQVLGIINGVPSWVYPPGYEWGYDQFSAGSVTITGTTEGTATTVITCAAHTFDGAPIIVDYFTSFARTPSTATGIIIIGLFESGTLINRLGQTQTATGIIGCSVLGSMRITPSAGSHSYVVAAWVSSTTGTPLVAGGAGGAGGANPPTWVRFTKV